MAVKKTTKKKAEPAKPAKASKPAVKKVAPAADASAAPAAPKAAKPKTAAPKPAAAKPAPVKLTASQADVLKKVAAAGEPGYLSDKKAEQRTLDALLERKLIKKGAKDKASGNVRYAASSAGKKHLESAGA